MSGEKVRKGTPLQVTPGQASLAGVAALGLGALASGTAHYLGSAKSLAEEGIDSVARLKALPMAARALLVSSLGSLGLAAVAAAGWSAMGKESRESAAVASWSDAMALATQQRVRFQLAVGWFPIDLISFFGPNQ
jgi:hypothetical protein